MANGLFEDERPQLRCKLKMTSALARTRQETEPYEPFLVEGLRRHEILSVVVSLEDGLTKAGRARRRHEIKKRVAVIFKSRPELFGRLPRAA